MKKLIFLQINEISFKLIDIYIKNGYKHLFRNLNSILPYVKETSSEVQYENLEPWIQWPSFYTGVPYNDHQIFRLGDSINSMIPQIFEELENIGIRVGCISPINAENRMVEPAFFIPDPWTDTRSDNSFFSRIVHYILKEFVNKNATGGVSLLAYLALIVLLLVTSRAFTYLTYIKLCLGSIAGKNWCKALLLDVVLNETHLYLLNKKDPNFSILFLNAAAHIQHHYMLNSKPLVDIGTIRNPEWYCNKKLDPILDMIKIYDDIIGDYLRTESHDLIIATGLSQVPYDRLKFYYRIKDHELFLKKLGLNFVNIEPRMSRDFLVNFSCEYDLMRAKKILSEVKMKIDDQLIFGEIEVQVLSMFISLTYPNEVDEKSVIVSDGAEFLFRRYTSLVAIKNSMHDSTGYVYFSDGVRQESGAGKIPVHELNNIVKNYYSIHNQSE